MARLTEEEEIELLLLLEQQERERVSPKLEAFRDPIIGGECPKEIRIRGCRGGRGAGAKSHSLVSLIVQRANIQRIRVGCFREIQESLDESVYALIKLKVEQLGYSGWIFQVGTIISPCGSKFIFKGLKDLRASRNVKGLEAFDIFFIEEAATISMDSWDLLMPTLMRNPGSQLWFAYNPESEFDPVTVKIWNRNRSDALLIELQPGPVDNPWWNDGLQKEMEEDYKADPDEAEHIWGGQPRKQGQRSVMSRVAIRAAMDRVIEPVGIVQIGCDVARYGDDRTVIYKRKGLKTVEHKQFSKQDTMTTAYECWAMANQDPSIPIYVDDSGVGGGVSDRLRELGAKVVPINFGGSPADKDRYTSVADELWFNFPIDEASIPDDPQLMAELSGRQYSYDHMGRRKIESKDDYKKRCGRSPDCFIAGTMIRTIKGNVPIERIKVGDKIITPLGIERVIKTWETDTEKLSTLYLKNGKILSGKPTHKIYTNSGFVPIDKLHNEPIQLFSYRRIIVWLILKMLFTKARSISFKQLADISNQERIFSELDLFIGEFGLKTMGLYQKDSMSTILMEIGEITRSAISNVFQEKNISLSMQKNGTRMKSIARKSRKGERKQYSKHLNGIDQKKEENGIANTEKKLGKDEKKSSANVLFVEKNLNRILQEQSIAAAHVRTNILRIIAKWLRRHVNIVAKSFIQKLFMIDETVAVVDHVERSCAGPVKTYNLTLEKHNVYYANDVLVENCADALLLCYFDGSGLIFPDEIRDQMARRRRW